LNDFFKVKKDDEEFDKYTMTVPSQLKKIICIYEDGTEIEWDKDKDRVKIVVQLIFENLVHDHLSEIHYMTTPKNFQLWKNQLPEKQLKINCLFCKRPLIIKYKLIEDVEETCYCGSIIKLTVSENHYFFIPNYEKLAEENKVKTKILDYDEYHLPLLYLLQYFPYTDDELKEVFTDRQIEVIKKRLNGEELNVSDRGVLKRIRDNIEEAKRLSKFKL